jgi:hypothetical protein
MSVDPPFDMQSLVSRALRRQVSLSEFSQPVYIEDVQTIDDLVSLSVRTRDGQTVQTIIPATELATVLDQATVQSTTGTLADPYDFFLLVEAARICLAYSFDPFFAVSMSGVQALPHQLQAPQVHTRIKEALRNRVVWDSVQPSKLVSLTKLNEQQPLERQYFPVVGLVSCFFSYYNWTHVWDERVVRQAIIVGIKNRTFAYVANAHKDKQENLVLSGLASATVHFGKDVPAHEIDMGEGAFLLSSAFAQQLLTPPAPPKIEPAPVPDVSTSTGEIQPGQQPLQVYIPAGEEGKTMVNDALSPTLAAQVPPPAKPVAPGQGGQRYRLRVRIKPGDFFEVTKALERLNESSATIDTTVIVIATAKPGQPFNANTLHNLVVEPMVEESDAIVLEEQVEE